MKDKELVSSDAIECEGVLGICSEEDATIQLITLDLLARGLRKVLKPTPALVQHFRDGTTRVLCPNLEEIDGDLSCIKRYALTADDDKLIAAIPEHMQNGDEHVAEYNPCPYTESPQKQ